MMVPYRCPRFQAPVVDADNAQRRLVLDGTSAHDPQQRVLADRQHEPPRQARSRAAAERNPEVVDDCVEAGRAAG
jgi:hypothetical protein